jgi:Zn-dependent protease with chaperone function
MNMVQIAKRVFLLVVVNILVMLTITVVLSLLRVNRYFPQGGLGGLAVICLIWGFAGAFISLALSRLMAKWMMGVQVIPPETSDPTLSRLVETVHGLARGANLPKLPEVGIYQSDEINAFATGPTRSRALVNRHHRVGSDVSRQKAGRLAIRRPQASAAPFRRAPSAQTSDTARPAQRQASAPWQASACVSSAHGWRPQRPAVLRSA